jgi:hypothetical protein
MACFIFIFFPILSLSPALSISLARQLARVRALCPVSWEWEATDRAWHLGIAVRSCAEAEFVLDADMTRIHPYLDAIARSTRDTAKERKDQLLYIKYNI